MNTSANAPRLILFVKSQGDFKHSGKYALINHRWRKLAHDEHHHVEPVHVPEFQEGKTVSGVKAYYEAVAQKLLDASAAGDVAAIEAIKAKGLQPNAKGKVGNTWKGKTPNSKLLLALHEQASGGAVPAAEAPAAEPVKPVVPATEQPATHVALADAKTNAWAPTLSKKVFGGPNEVWYSQQSGMDIQVHGTMKFEGQPPSEYAQTKLAQYKAAKNAGYEFQNFKVSGLQHAYVFVKDGQILTKHGMAQLMAGGAASTAEPPKKEPRLVIPVRKPKAQAAAPATTAVSKLDQIPWDAQFLPAENKNAKSHNKQVAAIKQMAYAGDIAGLQAFKAGSNTYGKKQMKLAAVAIEALKEETPEPKQALSENLQALMEAKPKVIVRVPKAEPVIPPPVTPEDEAAVEKMKAAKAGGYDKFGIFSSLTDDIDSAVSSGDASTLNDIDSYLNTPANKKEAGVDAIKQYLSEAKASMAGKTADVGPKEGDTKELNGVTYVLKNGRWHKLGEEPQPAAEPQHPIDAVPMPDVSGATNTPWKTHIVTSLEKLKEQVKQDPSALKGISKKMASGKYIFTLPHYLDTVHPDNKAKFTGYGESAKNVHSYIEALKVAAGKAPKKASPAAAAKPAVSNGMSMDGWEQTGKQLGSNPGGKFKDPSGQEWYVKFPADEDIAKSELLAAKLYAAMGFASQDAKLVTQNGKVGIASKWENVSKASSPSALSGVDGVASGFAADAWLGNWDVVGLGFDNLQIGADGKAHRVDAGGSLEYRAQGGKKAFGPSVTEIDSLRDPKINPQAAAVFGKLSEADITASVSKVLAIPDATIAILVNKYGPGSEAEKQKMINTLIARKADLAAKYPKSKKEPKKVEFDPSQVSAPPDFMNWGGSGKSGPSSKQFLNEANHRAAQYIFEAAKTGNIEAVKAISAPVYNKETGEVTGKSPVLQHPSQHIKGYAQQVINEINYQLNPPKKFRFEGGHPLNALNAAYPPVTNSAQVDAVTKAGKFIALGEPGVISPDELGLPKITYQSGALNQATYSPAAKASISKMPLTQQQALKSYTGSGYQEINSSLWNGNPVGKAASAGQALHTLGHDIAPGTVLSRKITVHGTGLDQILSSAGKVLQEPAIMSTSIRPSSWSGNVQLKMRVGPGVKGLWVGHGSKPDGGALSNHSGEDEMILPPNTRLLIVSVKKGGSSDEDGFGVGVSHVIEAIILPSEGN